MVEMLKDFLPLVAVLIAIVLVLRLGWRRKSVSKSPRPRATDDATGGYIRLQKAIEKLHVNLMEFGRDVEARLDTRIRTLGRLIQDADERIKRLEELSGKASAPGAKEPPPLHREVYRLADEGLDKVEIARRAASTPGEVELILGLRKTRNE
ncbi:MAG: hypothetical protein J7M19_08130 [Planctomycetes bacterium]|nr:hypothetical protein [Planctomycetota bacterium]